MMTFPLVINYLNVGIVLYLKHSFKQEEFSECVCVYVLMQP